MALTNEVFQVGSWLPNLRRFRCAATAGGPLSQYMFQRIFILRRDHGSWSSEYGQFFLHWYSRSLLNHADSMLEVATKVFGSSPIQLQVKLPAVHWWHHTQSHAVRSRSCLMRLRAVTLIYSYGYSTRSSLDPLSQAFQTCAGRTHCRHQPHECS